MSPANGKLCGKNNRECYHCNVNNTAAHQSKLDHLTRLHQRNAQSRINHGSSQPPAKESGPPTGSPLAIAKTAMQSLQMRSETVGTTANRTPLVEGYVSETDCRPASRAPLHGRLPGLTTWARAEFAHESPTCGTTRVDDHAVSNTPLPKACSEPPGE